MGRHFKDVWVVSMVTINYLLPFLALVPAFGSICLSIRLHSLNIAIYDSYRGFIILLLSSIIIIGIHMLLSLLLWNEQIKMNVTGTIWLYWSGILKVRGRSTYHEIYTYLYWIIRINGIRLYRNHFTDKDKLLSQEASQ